MKHYNELFLAASTPENSIGIGLSEGQPRFRCAYAHAHWFRGCVSIGTDLVYEFLRDSSSLSNVAILNKFNHQIPASGSDSL